MENSDGVAKLLPGMSITHPLKTLVPLDQLRYELPPGLSLDASPLLYVQAAALGPCANRDLKLLGLPDALNLKNVALSGLEADKLADLFCNIKFFVFSYSNNNKKAKQPSLLSP